MIKKIDVTSVLLFFLFLSFLNAPLRLSPEGLSLYRLFIPFQLLILTLFAFSYTKKLFLLYSLIIFFSFFGFLISGYHFNVNMIVFSIHYFIILLLFFNVKYLVEISNEDRLFTFLKYSFLFIVSFCFVDMLGVPMPNIDHVNYAIRSIFKIENDLSIALVSFCFLLLYIRFNIVFTVVACFFVLVLSFYNDSKISFIGLFIIIIIEFFFFNSKVGRKDKLYICSFVFIFLCIIIYNFHDFEINFPGHTYTLFELILEPIIRILTLNPYGYLYGSIYNRTDMFIFSLKDIFNSFGFGTGLGNTLTMLDSERYGIIGSAKSIHNFPLQFITEVGFFVSSFIVFKLLKEKGVREVFYFTVLMIASLSQSVGLFSNYFFFCCLFLMLLWPKPIIEHN